MIRFIYRTTNKLNGHDYIGQHTTNDINDGYLGSGTLLKKAIEKYGKENFKREILRYCSNNDELNRAESELIDLYEPYYNIAPGGDGLSSDWWTEERREDMRQKLSGENNPNFGKPMSEEQKKKISIANTGKTSWFKGKHMDDEYKAKLSKSIKIAVAERNYNGKENPFYGKHFSKEVTEHLSKVRKGKHWYNNGIEETTAYECPEGYQIGRIKQ